MADVSGHSLNAFSSSLQRPIKRGSMDTKQAGDLSYRPSVLLDKLARVGDTSSIKCWGWAKTHAARFGDNPSGAGAFHDKGALEIGHTGEHCEDHAAGRSGSVGPRFGQRSQTGVGVLDTLRDVQQVTGGPGQPIEASDSHHVAGAKMLKQTAKLGPVPFRATDLFFEDAGAFPVLRRR